MKLKQKIAIGPVLLFFGGLGIVLGPSFGFSNLGVPGSFITEFAFGILSGLGAILSIAGLIKNYELNKQKI